MSEIRPALTEAEWASGTGGPDCWGFRGGELWCFGSSPYEEFQIRDENRHAVAALALHDQPFGFTWEDVDRLREAVIFEQYEGVPDREEGEKLGNLADRIAALLPPREEFYGKSPLDDPDLEAEQIARNVELHNRLEVLQRKPRITRGVGGSVPHCGRCGVEYDRKGYDRGSNTESYEPRCPCWQRAYEPRE